MFYFFVCAASASASLANQSFAHFQPTVDHQRKFHPQKIVVLKEALSIQVKLTLKLISARCHESLLNLQFH